MRKFTVVILVLVAFVAATAVTSLANSIKVTFVNSAQKSGKIDARIYYSVSDFYSVTSTTTHSRGTSAEVKASRLADDVNNQCYGDVTATANGNEVTMSSGSGFEIKGIAVSDGTVQKMIIDGRNLDPNPSGERTFIELRIAGTGGGGTAELIMNCGTSSTTSTTGKTGSQIAADLVAGLTNCDGASGSRIEAKDVGGGVGLIRFLALSDDNSVLTFNPGDTVLTGVFLFKTWKAAYVPSITVWGLLILLALLVLSGIVVGRRRRANVTV